MLIVVTVDAVVENRTLLGKDKERAGNQFRGAVVDVSDDGLDVAVEEGE